ncbi:MAG TPA: hypothetical protein VHR86_01740, partial [Armatimonadota bacterium]|nr:hypothetical protein [Armatimonadota bacterium]
MTQLAAAEAPVSGLQAAYRNGQVFLTWKETETPTGSFFNIYLAKEPITTANLAQARRVGHHVERHSARDWWQDPASFDPNAAPGTPAGFQIENGAAPLDPQGGLFVHTALPGDGEKCYFALTATTPQGEEEKTLAPGANTLVQPVACKVAPPQPIWLGKGDTLAQAAGKGKSLLVNLHARGGGITAGPNPQEVNALF